MISGRQCSGAQWFHLVFSLLSKSFLQPSFHNLAFHFFLNLFCSHRFTIWLFTSFKIFSAALFSQLVFSHLSKHFLQPSHFSCIAHSLTFHIVTFLESLDCFLVPHSKKVGTWTFENVGLFRRAPARGYISIEVGGPTWNPIVIYLSNFGEKSFATFFRPFRPVRLCERGVESIHDFCLEFRHNLYICISFLSTTRKSDSSPCLVTTK